jgi:methionine-gamma-lyase
MILTETELNPFLALTPIDKIAEIVEAVNVQRMAKGWRPVLFVVDNTFPTFANLNPFNFGVHLDAESTTKFICGKGDNMGGFAAIDMAHDFRLPPADCENMYRDIMMRHKDDGLAMSPFVAWDLLRGLPDIEMRREWVQTRAQKVAEFLKEHPDVALVNYPGMTGDREMDDRARLLMRDEQGRFAPGYMIYFVLKGDFEEAKAKAAKLLDWLSKHTMLKVKVSFGQKDTCIETPAGMTHCSYSEAELAEADIHAGGIRLAMGWDNPDYVIDCLREGLKHI